MVGADKTGELWCKRVLLAPHINKQTFVLFLVRGGQHRALDGVVVRGDDVRVQRDLVAAA